MSADVRLLERLVNQAVERLKGLAEERDRLRQELESLEERPPAPEEGRPERWAVERQRVAETLREALAELRGD